MNATFAPEKITPEEVAAYREDTGAGMVEAKRTLRLRNLARTFEKLRREGTTEEKVDWILDRLEEMWWPE